MKTHKLFLLLLRQRSPPLALVLNSSQGTLSSTNFSSVSPSHGSSSPTCFPFQKVQFIKDRQCGFPTKSQVLPANLLWCGLHSPQVIGPCQDSVPAWSPSLLSGTHLLLCRSTLWAAGGALHPPGPPCKGTAATPGSSPWAARESHFGHLKHLCQHPVH